MLSHGALLPVLLVDKTAHWEGWIHSGWVTPKGQWRSNVQSANDEVSPQRCVEVAHELDLVVERLRHEFAGIEADVIDQIVHEEAARFENARVQNFVCLLTEKAAKQTLREYA
jgi:hypothetical protein